jgi:hypothetical protein
MAGSLPGLVIYWRKGNFGHAGAAAWPLVARAQQAGRVRRIGVLMGLAESDPEAQLRVAAVRAKLFGNWVR